METGEGQGSTRFLLKGDSMEPKPKERIVFDEDSYYGDEGEEMAINDLMERDGLTEGEVREDFHRR